MDNNELNKLEALAQAATPQNFDSAQITNQGWIECPSCDGSGEVELTADYCNYDGRAIGVQFYGIGPEHRAAEAFYRAANPAAILELIALARAGIAAPTDAWHDAVLAECMRIEAAYKADDPVATLKELIDYHANGSDIASTNKVLADNYLKLTCGAAPTVPTDWRTALRRSGANSDYHGLIAFTPAQLEDFVSRLAAPAAAEGPSKPELTVWYGSLPESNGAQNFTAMLMRKGGSIMDGGEYTFAHSEYPDRVRYEADCMRHLIGELDEEPFIGDYDADKHSGYATPLPTKEGAGEVDAKDAVRMDWIVANKATLTRLHDDSGYIVAINGRAIRSSTSLRFALDSAMSIAAQPKDTTDTTKEKA